MNCITREKDTAKSRKIGNIFFGNFLLLQQDPYRIPKKRLLLAQLVVPKTLLWDTLDQNES